MIISQLIKRIAQLLSYGKTEEEVAAQLKSEGIQNDEAFLIIKAAQVFLKGK